MSGADCLGTTRMNIIFDIDDTLIRSGAFDGGCFIAAVRDVHGDVSVRSDWNSYTHVTDQGLIEQIAIENGLTDACVEDVKARYVARIDAHLAQVSGDGMAVPGAQAMLQAVQPAHRVALATGGWRDVQKIKLAKAGIGTDLPMFASDGIAPRAAIMAACHAAIGDPEMDTLYVGDGEWDMRACKELGWHFIGIGTRLKGRCERWIEDFTGSDFLSYLASIDRR